MAQRDEYLSFHSSAMGYVRTGMCDRFHTLIVSLMALRLALVDQNPFHHCFIEIVECCPGRRQLRRYLNVSPRRDKYNIYSVDVTDEKAKIPITLTS